MSVGNLPGGDSNYSEIGGGSKLICHHILLKIDHKFEFLSKSDKNSRSIFQYPSSFAQNGIKLNSLKHNT